jgi:Protein of unknown function (DUF1207)
LTNLIGVKKTEDEMTKQMRITTCPTVTSCLCAASLCLILLFTVPPAVAADRTSDEFLTGYISAILERDLQWERGSYRVKVVKRVATITDFKDDPIRREEAGKQLRSLDNLQGIKIVVKPADADNPGAVTRFLKITGESEAFPTGDVFEPLIADPKQPRFFVSFYRFASEGERYTMASVGFGETFGLYRKLGSREGDGLQVSVEAALFAQFNMDTPSHDLQNADYTIGIPVTYRYGDNSLRFRVYHQSSHLGDELLLSVNPPNRVNLSFEAVEIMYSRDWRGWRVYGGGEYAFDRDPSDLKPLEAHWGIEYRGSTPIVWNGKPIVGVDMKSLQEHDWSIDTSVKAGLEFGSLWAGQRRLSVLLEWYKGYDPHGQFYVNRCEYLGGGITLGF